MSHPTGQHLLGPHVVGRRVVVRRLLRGERGPTGGPAFTDVLGTCTAWGEGVCVVEADRGRVEIAIADIVSGKPVPPRPSVRHRASPREAHLHSLAMWPDAEQAGLGEWVLRAAGRLAPDAGHPEGRLVARANSVLAMGDPGLPLAEAAGVVGAFYSERHLPVWVQVVVGGDVDEGLSGLGWEVARPGEGDTLFQVAGVARVLRLLARSAARQAAAGRAAAPALEEDGDRAVARIDERARARVAVDGDWVGIHDVWVSEPHRRLGLAGVAMLEVLDWAAGRGATTAYLQVRADNPGALALYEQLGFSTHHAYRYLTRPRVLPSSTHVSGRQDRRTVR